jgi:DnaK suppressor protein
VPIDRIGAPNVANVTIDPAQARAALLAERADLERRADAVRRSTEGVSGGISFGKRVGEGTSIAIERFADVAVHGQMLQQLAAIDVAIERLDAGSYGFCLVCGREILDERLEAIPWAANCVSCS